MKVAIVCDWLTNVGGAERVLKEISDLYPAAPIFTSQYNPKRIDWFKDRTIKTGWLQIFPSNLRRFLGPLRQKYFSNLDLSDYDLVISVTGAEAKSIKKGNAIHLCYCHVPTQYYWGLYDHYVENPGFGILNPMVRFFFKALVDPLRKADFEAAKCPDRFITISTYAAEQIKKFYKRESTIIFPPVAVENFSKRELSTTKIPEQGEIKSKKSQAEEVQIKEIKNKKSQITHLENSTETSKRHGFVITSRHVTWKRIDLAIKACLSLNLPLTVIGEGPETKNLKKLANNSPLIKFIPLLSQKDLKKYLETSEAYIFPSLEPFGIAPVEALAAGCPVIAYGKGGATDYITNDKNGVFFKQQSVNSLCQAIKHFKKLSFSEDEIRKSALPFSEKNFKDNLKRLIKNELKKTPSNE